MLEVIRLEGHSLAQEDAFVSRDIHLLQVLPLTLVEIQDIICIIFLFLFILHKLSEIKC